MQHKKTISLLMAAIIISVTASAQIINKGNIMAGINASRQTFYSDSVGNFNRSLRRRYVNFSPYFQLGIKKNLAAGIYLTVSHTPEGDFGFNSKYHDWAAGMYIKKYVEPGKRFYAFGMMALQYSSTAGKSYSSIYNSSSIGLYASAGIGYRVSKKVNLELTFNNMLGIKSTMTENNLNGTLLRGQKINFTHPGNVFAGNGISLGINVRF